MLKRVNSKKGIADIVAVTLIILLSTVSVSLMFSYVNGATSSLSPIFNCFYAQTNQIYELTDVCMNTTSSQIVVRVYRSLQDDSTTDVLKITLTRPLENSISYTCGPGTSCHSAEIPEPGENKEFYLSHSYENLATFDEAHLSINGCVLDNIQISPSC